MYFVEFPVSATNIFPLANSNAGGQLLSEHDLRSRESVATDPSVKYPIGPSYTHSEDDFRLYRQGDGVDIPATAIQISPGRAVVNGHYVELLTPIVIDLATVNYKAGLEKVDQLKGDLAIGLVMMYSTYQTLAASALAENADGYYEGIRVVIVPEQDVKRPVDVPEEYQYEEVNMHLKLGTFTFYNGTVANVNQDPNKLKVFDASRIGDLGSTLDDRYVTKDGLDPNRNYIFSSKSSDGIHVDGGDTWCSADESLMVWDVKNPKLLPIEPMPTIAHFEYNPVSDGSKVIGGVTELVLPHKQVDGAINQDGQRVWFQDMRYQIPNANYSKNSGGVVSPKYTERILQIEEKVNQIYRLPNGVMRKYLAKLTIPPTTATGVDGALPTIPVAEGSVVPLDIDNVVAQLISSIDESKNIVSNSVTSINTIVSTLDTVSSTVNSVASSISDESARASTVKSLLTNVSSYLTTATTALTGGQNYADASGQITRAIHNLTSRDSTDYGCTYYLSEVADSVSAARAHILDPDTATSDLNSAISSLNSASGKANSVNSNLNSASNYITTASINVSDASSDVSTAKTAISTCITNLNKAHDKLQKDNATDVLDQLTSVISTLNGLVGASASSVGTLKYCESQLAKVKSSLEDLSTTISQYVNDEVERRLDEQTVLKETVWSPGDYVVVAEDQTQPQDSNGTYPSTMYVVNYGQIETIAYVDNLTIEIQENDADKYTKLDLFRHKVPYQVAGGVELEYTTTDNEQPTPTDITNLNFTTYYGAVGKDYFVIHHEQENYQTVDGESTLVSTTYTNFFYTPSSTKLDLTYVTPPLKISYGVPIATEEVVGGFLSASPEDYGQGYVYVDELGHLRMVDYNYLMLGLEAQQLGVNTEIGSGMDIATMQENLNDLINDRICYPNATQIANAEADEVDPHIIHLYLDVPSTTETTELKIHDIGSRANSYLYVHILGSATSATTIVFENCDKLRIDDTIQGQPNIVLKNVNLYYSSNVLDRTVPYTGIATTTGIENLTLWYERDYSDSASADLQVDGMTVTLVGTIEDTMDFDPWDSENPNDNHYSYALRSLTFASDGSIIGASLLVSDGSTMNIDPGISLFRANFTLPQNSGLSYPSTKLTRRIKITGAFDTGYWSPLQGKYILKQTTFSAMTSTVSMGTPGSIAFCTNTTLVSHITGVAVSENIDCWDLNTMHVFYGGAID